MNWINVKERLPEEGDYLAYWWNPADRLHEFRVAGLFRGDWYINNNGPHRNLITHWQPLPAPPPGGGKEEG